MMNDSMDESLLDQSDDTHSATVSEGGGEVVDLHGLLDLGGEESDLTKEINRVGDENISDLTEVEGAGSMPAHRTDPPPEAEVVTIENVGMENEGPKGNQGTLDHLPTPSMVIVSEKLLGLKGTQLEKARDLLNVPFKGPPAMKTQAPTVTAAHGGQKTSGGTEHDLGSINGVGGGNLQGKGGAQVYQSEDIRCKLYTNRKGELVPPSIKGPTVTSVLCAAPVADNLMIGADDVPVGDGVEAEDHRGGRASVDDEDDDESEEDDESAFVTPQNSPIRVGSKAKPANVKTAAQLETMRAKKKRKAVAQKARRAAVRADKANAARLATLLQNLAPMEPRAPEGEGVAVQKPPPGGTLKRSAIPLSSTLSKRSKVDTSPAALGLSRYLSGVSPLAETQQGAQHNPLYRHGSVSVSLLKSFALQVRAHKPPLKDDPLQGHPSDVWRDEHGLLMLELDQTNSMVGPATATARQRSGDDLQGRLLFFSSSLLSFGRRIDRGLDYRCALCLSAHTPLPKSHVVLMSGSELLAAPGLPFNIRRPNIVSDAIPVVHPQQCWDTLMVNGGLRSDPFKVAQAIYGSYQGGLCFLLDVGTQPVVHGESAASVSTRLCELARKLILSLRSNTKGTTRVICLPPQLHLGDLALAQNQIPSGPHNALVLSQLLELKQFIDSRNCDRLGRQDRTSPLHTWSDLFSSLQPQLTRDPMNRIVGKVQAVASPGAVEDDGVLHLKPDYLHASLSNLVAFTVAHSWCSW